jgi:uncharacterized protein YbbK (DUF523 family)
MEKILVSACLLGAKVRYHGGDAACDHPILQRWLDEGRVVAVCPERDGGLPTPRPAAEIVGPGAGNGVIARLASVRTSTGADVTEAFRLGAEIALDAVKRHGIRIAVLKDGSPSCGSSFVYDGTFSGARIADRGVTAALLESQGVRVFTERTLEDADAYLREIADCKLQTAD